ncbi:hypothetical protein EDD21DRAFT_408436 [Dissophora ornata]|nr:hypothetical protein EDD21DRAFT_408436 [Dissophora ornata]
MTETAMSAHDQLKDASIGVQDTTKEALESMKRLGFVQQYVLPTFDWLKDKLYRSSVVVRITILTFLALSAVPIGCFIGFMGVVTLGCLIVGGIAFAIVEGGFAVFASAFLLPALGLVLLITCALGLFGSVIYGGYRFATYVVGVVWGQGSKRDHQHMIEHGAVKSETTGA